MNQPTLIDGQIFPDERGYLIANNNFDIQKLGIKRQYLVKNWKDNTIRAFHGHRHESKWIQVLSGTVKIAFFPVSFLENNPAEIRDCMENRHSITKNVVLYSESPKILHIPSGYYHGWKNFTKDCILLVSSDKTLEESKEDDLRQPWDEMGKCIWADKYY